MNNKSVTMCGICGSEVQDVKIPSERELVIPFTQWSIVLRNYGNKVAMCIECELEKQNDRSRKLYGAGYKHGYFKGHEDKEG